MLMSSFPCATGERAVLFGMATHDAPMPVGGWKCDPLAIMAVFSDVLERVLRVPVLLSHAYLA